MQYLLMAYALLLADFHIHKYPSVKPPGAINEESALVQKYSQKSIKIFISN